MGRPGTDDAKGLPVPGTGCSQRPAEASIHWIDYDGTTIQPGSAIPKQRGGSVDGDGQRNLSFEPPSAGSQEQAASVWQFWSVYDAWDHCIGLYFIIGPGPMTIEIGQPV